MNANAFIVPDAGTLIPLIAFGDRYTSGTASYYPPYSEYVPGFIDDDPISPEEEEDLFRSMEDLSNGNITIVPKSSTDEEFLKMLEH